MKKAVGIIVLLLGVLFVVTFTIGEERCGAFKIPVHIRTDRVIVDAEYRTVSTAEDIDDDSRPWKDLDTHKWLDPEFAKDRYVVSMSYVKVGSQSLLTGKKVRYGCASNVWIRLHFDDGSRLSVFVPLHAPYDGRPIRIDTSKGKN